MMNCILAAILLTGVDAAKNTTDYYNILAIDGGGIRGLISAKVLENIETMAYEYAKSKNYTFPEYPGEKAKGKFAMKDLFNMTAGTSTGSIIAAGLAYPDKNHTDIKMPGFFAPDLLEIYSDRGDEIFVKKQLSWGRSTLWLIWSMMIFGSGSFFLGQYIYDNQEVLDSFTDMRDQISNAKAQQKGKPAKKAQMIIQTPRQRLNTEVLDLKRQISISLMAQVHTKEEQISKKAKSIVEKKIGKVLLGEAHEIQHTQMLLSKARAEYEINRPKQWVILVIGLVFGVLAGIGFPYLINLVTNSLYSRKSLDHIMVTLLGSYEIEDALTDELMIVAYEYNSMRPRFYSKWFAKRNEAIYEVPIGNATGASSAAPTFFDPKVNVNTFGMTELLIDGGIICNNPSLYAYQLAYNMHNESNIRVMSIGTGEKPFTKIDAESFNIAEAMSKSGEFMMNMDTYTADNWLKTYMNDPTNNYIRLQTVSKIGMDKIDKASIDGLKKDGQTLYDDNTADIEKFIKTIIDERYGPKTA